MHDDKTRLWELLQSIVPIPQEEWDWLAKQLLEKSIPPKQLLFKPDTTDKSIHFLRQGLLRYFYVSKDGVERNHAFACEGQLSACFAAVAGLGSCDYSIEALELTHTLLIPGDTVKQSTQRHSCWRQLQVQLMAHAAKRKTERERDLMILSAEQRYREFLHSFAPLADRIPQYHIASYLAITPVALSRIRQRNPDFP